MGYHLVTCMALAKWFIEQCKPVGRFLCFGRPTQVYCPADAPDHDLLIVTKDTRFTDLASKLIRINQRMTKMNDLTLEAYRNA